MAINTNPDNTTKHAPPIKTPSSDTSKNASLEERSNSASKVLVPEVPVTTAPQKTISKKMSIETPSSENASPVTRSDSAASKVLVPEAPVTTAAKGLQEIETPSSENASPVTRSNSAASKVLVPEAPVTTAAKGLQEIETPSSENASPVTRSDSAASKVLVPEAPVTTAAKGLQEVDQELAKWCNETPGTEEYAKKIFRASNIKKCNFFGELERSLAQWCNAKQGTEEYPKRIIAAEKIKKSYLFKESELDLSNLGLTSFPPLPESNADLKKLDLSHNQLDCIPGIPDVTLRKRQFRDLQTLDLSHNHFTSFMFVCNSDFPKLQTLDLSHNHLASFATRIDHRLDLGISQLQTLDLSHNHLASFVFDCDKLCKLQTLDLSDNHLTSFDTCLGDKTASELGRLQWHVNEQNKLLKRLEEESHKLARTCPQESQEFAKTRHIKRENKDEKESLLYELLEQKMVNLVTQREDALKKIGDLSAQICLLDKRLGLHKLVLTNNRLTSIEKISELKNLQMLDLGSNQVTSISEKFGQLEELQHLDLTHNQLTFLPSQISALKKLHKIYVDGNIDVNGNQLLSSQIIGHLPKDVNKTKFLRRKWH